MRRCPLRMLTLLHTSDWHLGHTLHDLPRTEEHASFLAWLVDLAANERADALVVAGDLFETSNPSAEAQGQLYRFLVSLRARCPNIDVVLVAGNHDSPARLDAPVPILDALGIRMIGALPRKDGALDLDRLLVPLHDRTGAIAAWVAAVPFLRPADLPTAETLAESVTQVYTEALEAARARRSPGQALLATGHLYMRDGALSEGSERRIQGGNLHALPPELFPADIAYVALGHLHLAQPVGNRPNVRYSGSPLPLSMAERDYPHQVCVVRLDGEACTEVRPVFVPRTTDLIRVPEEGALPLDELLAELRKLPYLVADTPDWRRPFLEACVLLDAPEPGIQRRVEEVLDGGAARLVKLTRMRTPGAPDPAHDPRPLADLTPHEVFRKRWEQEYPHAPIDPALLACFDELLAGP